MSRWQCVCQKGCLVFSSDYPQSIHSIPPRTAMCRHVPPCGGTWRSKGFAVLRKNTPTPRYNGQFVCIDAVNLLCCGCYVNRGGGKACAKVLVLALKWLGRRCQFSFVSATLRLWFRVMVWECHGFGMASNSAIRLAMNAKMGFLRRSCWWCLGYLYKTLFITDCL